MPERYSDLIHQEAEDYHENQDQHRNKEYEQDLHATINLLGHHVNYYFPIITL